MAKKKVVLSNFKRSKERVYDVIPLDPESFFVELGYSSTSWKSQRTRISNKLGLHTGQSLSPRDCYLILESISKSSSKCRGKAKEWLDIFNNIPEDTECEHVEIELLNIPQELLQKYDVSIEDVTEKHNIIKKETTTRYIYELNRRLSIYRFGYDIRICELLKECYKAKLLDDVVFDERTFDDEYVFVDEVKVGKFKYKAKSKDGVVKEFNNIASFASEYDLTAAALKKILAGKQKSHKGWTISENGSIGG